ncbi:hypothetical protein EFZ10_10255 [Tatumella sp. TA1]|nr:hypothetical protein EFZ10_10255 [Tatumella sp. TA1]
MKKIAIAAISLILSTSAIAGGRYYHLSGTGSSYSHSRASGYMRSNGIHVNSYERTTRDSTQLNNYSTKGNYNPSTGKIGTRYATH